MEDDDANVMQYDRLRPVLISCWRREGHGEVPREGKDGARAAGESDDDVFSTTILPPHSLLKMSRD
jgi:hypothetical protein